MKILLLYASLEGQTEKITLALREHLSGMGARVTLANVRQPEQLEGLVLADFDRLVFGASIHMGKAEKEMVAFINAHAPEIETRPRSLFLVLMAAASGRSDKRDAYLAEVRDNVTAGLEVTFDDVEMIAGALMYTRYGWMTKWIMRYIAGREGRSTDTSRDHEYTDWNQVAAYAQRLAE